LNKAQLGIPNHTTYAGPRPTYINLHLDPPKHELVRTTREHNTPLPYQIPIGWVQATLAISHAQCTVIFSHNGIAEVSGLPEYVASCKVSTHAGLQQTVLNQHRRKHYIETPFSMQATHPIQIKFTIILHYPCMNKVPTQRIRPSFLRTSPESISKDVSHYLTLIN
jgi:hypothetical protein